LVPGTVVEGGFVDEVVEALAPPKLEPVTTSRL
jgi:hypothetical protein